MGNKLLTGLLILILMPAACMCLAIICGVGGLVLTGIGTYLWDKVKRMFKN